jgi:tetratricopeptide (TPR) repeat protein
MLIDSFVFKELLVKGSLTIGRHLIALVVASLLTNATVFANELPRLKLMSPLSSISLSVLADEADSAYKSKQLKAAQEGFQTILELDPGNRRAMFRLGNIFQQLGNTEQAVSFYRQAASTNEFSQTLDEFGEKALINIALLASEQLRAALEELEKRNPNSKDSTMVQSLIDDLGHGTKTLAARVVVSRNNPALRQISAPLEASAPEIINGSSTVKHSIKPAPRVTYSQLADPSKDLTEITYIKGAPVKVAKPKETNTRTLYRKIVQRKGSAVEDR